MPDAQHVGYRSRVVPFARKAPSAGSEEVDRIDHGHDNVPMSTLSREELSAELRAMRADMRAWQADIRTDLAQSQKAVSEAVAGIGSTVGALREDIALTKGAVVGAAGQIDGLKTVSQWSLGILGVGVAVVGILVAVVIARQPPPTPPASAPTVLYLTPPATAAPPNEASPNQ